MCELNAYLLDRDENRLIMKGVDTVEPLADGICLTSILGDQKVIQAFIHSISTGTSSIFLKEL